MKRKCMYCAEPIFESMGYVLPRDVILMLEGEWDIETMGLPRELCWKNTCNNKWKETLYRETGNIDFLINI